ncbi:hypothetical protein [Streptomyces lavendofoliae]|uniref:hypothetical protein n=1 Tax=Streptomyces lavendofoliae TaxID=67314 RepID=UPI0016752D99|nr:hypothetical protein [Streptomyces lavendofoliae]
MVADLKVLHGESWADHFAPVLGAALQAGESWAVNVMHRMLERAHETVRLAERVGGGPGLALQHVQGMDKKSAGWFVDLVLEARAG